MEGRTIDAFLTLVEELLTSLWLHPLMLLGVIADAVAPIVPAETLLISAAAFGASGPPNLLLLGAASALGAFLGDSLMHHLGRRLRRWGRGGPPEAGLPRRLARRITGRRDSAEVDSTTVEMLRRRGGIAVLAGRFIPGGRTTVSTATGLVGYPTARFHLFAAVGAVLWAGYMVGLGSLGGIVFAESPWLGVLCGLGLATVVGVGGELARRLAAQRRISKSSSGTEARSSSVAGREASSSTTACSGPVRHQATNCSTASGDPAATASTAPSAVLRTQPASPSWSARDWADAR